MGQHCPIKCTSFSYKRENIPHTAFSCNSGLATAEVWDLIQFNSNYLSSFYPFTGYNPRIWNLSIHHLSVISELSQHNTSFKGHKAHNQISTLQYCQYHPLYKPQWLHNLSKTLSTYIHLF